MLNKIKNIKLSRSAIIFIAGALFVLLFLKQCDKISDLRQDVKIAETNAERNFNNYLAANDSVTYLQNQNGDMLATIRSYEFDISDLRDDQNNLIKKYNNVLSLNRDLNKVNTLLSADLAIKDSLLAASQVTQIDSITGLITYNKSDDFGNGNTRTLNGSSTVRFQDGRFLILGQSQFNIDQTLSLSAAVEEVDGANRLKLSTSYPGLTISNIENINLINTKLNQKQDKKAGWSIGFGVGYGVNLNNNQVISYGPSIGVGLYWSPKFLRF
jgi:hypothetical protein